MFVTLGLDIISYLGHCIASPSAGLSALYLPFAWDNLYRLVFLKCSSHWLPLTFTVNSCLLNMALRVNHSHHFRPTLAPLPFIEVLYHPAFHGRVFICSSICALYTCFILHEMCCCSFHLFLLLFNICFPANLYSRVLAPVKPCPIHPYIEL